MTLEEAYEKQRQEQVFWNWWTTTDRPVKEIQKKLFHVAVWFFFADNQ